MNETISYSNLYQNDTIFILYELFLISIISICFDVKQNRIEQELSFVLLHT